MPPDQKQDGPSSKDFQKVLRDIAENKKAALLNVTAIFAKNRASLLKDYLTVSLAILGGAITVLTVKPNLAKTAALLYAGSILVLVVIILIFMSRRSYIAQEETQMTLIEKDYADMTGYIGNSITANNTSDQFMYIQKAAQVQGNVISNIPKFYQNSEKYLGLMLLIGGLSVAISLLFKVGV